MRKINIFSAVLSLFLLVPASITRAQNVSSQKGLLTASFTQPIGKTIIYLPDDLRPGELVSGSIHYLPEGKNEKQVAANLKALKDQYFLVNGTRPGLNNETQHFQFMVMLGDGQIELFSSNGKNFQSASFSPAAINDDLPLQSCNLPTHALVGSPKSIKGPFDGNLDNTSCTLNEEPIQILAESKRQCILSYPANASGSQQLKLQEAGNPSCSGMVEGVTLTARAGKKTLMGGEQTYLEIIIRGLQNLPGMATLRVNNLSGTTVSLLPSNSINIPLAPDSITNGIFDRRFVIVGIRPGDFAISVDLDLPEQADHPPTQPQPNEPTQPQCPKCECKCSADLKFEGKEGDVAIYSVTVTASCSGQFGKPPCETCAVASYKYDWTISFSADKPVEWEGDHSGSIVKVKNPSDVEFSIWVIVTVTCRDGNFCTCTAKSSSHPPTVPIDEKKCLGCLCECSANILSVDTDGEEWEYSSDIKAVCFRNYGDPPCTDCFVKSITYLWSMPGEDVAKIVGARNGASVKVRTIKPGKFVLNLVVSVTCSDGHQCECKDSEEGIVPEKGCNLSWLEMNQPIMTATVSGIKTEIKRRDEFINLKASGEDNDKLKLICVKQKDCPDLGSVKYLLISGVVQYQWTIKGPGSFVGIGCLDERKTAMGDQVIFKPPFVPLPEEGKADTKITTELELIISDDDAGGFNDPSITKKYTVTVKRTKLLADFYEISFVEAKSEPRPETTSTTDVDLQCDPDPKWIDSYPIIEPVIILPAAKDNTSLLSGEWIRLESKNQKDIDALSVMCVPTTKDCESIRKYSGLFNDKLEWTWTASEGTFAGSKLNSDKGRVVIYEAPVNIKSKRVITITVKVDDDGTKFDDPEKTITFPLTVYPAGIKLDYPDKFWVPDPAIPATVKSYLVYEEDGKWKAAFEHSCRIHFFELMNVSNEPGVCLNEPQLNLANKCPDLRFKIEKGLEVFGDKRPDKDCKEPGYFMQARTELPMNTVDLKVYAEDYGAFGFVRSLANTYEVKKVEIPEGKTSYEDWRVVFTGKAPFYKSIVNKTEDHIHPHVNKEGKRVTKLRNYEDNRVNIPKDIDENHIPDEGWIATPGGGRYPDANESMNMDADDEPVGDGFPGDGLAVYEEYRGFKVKSSHHRTYPKVKDLFVSNAFDLPIDEFVRITRIPVHEITESQYGPMEKNYFNKNKTTNSTKNNQRFVNFNFGIGHITDQKGLHLFAGRIGEIRGVEGIIMGWTPSEKEAVTSTATPAPPNWNVEVKVDRDTIRVVCNKDDKDAMIFESKLKQVVAHELCHALNVYHHGEGDAGLIRGNKDCIMRYDNWGRTNETPGTTLCEKLDGADATKKRGACALQIRIAGRLVEGSHGYPTRL